MFKTVLLIAIALVSALALFLMVWSKKDDKDEKEFHLAFVSSLIIVVSRLYAVTQQIRRLSAGIPYVTDYVDIGLSLFIISVLLFVPDKNWRTGMVFVVASFITGNLSKLLSQNSISVAILFCVVSILFLIPASFYFYKLKGKAIKF